MVLSLIPQAVFAKEVLVSPLHYEMSQRIHDDKMAATICLEFDKTNAVELEKVILPDGTEQINDLTIVNYDVFENGVYDFIVEYTLDSVKPVSYTHLQFASKYKTCPPGFTTRFHSKSVSSGC